MPRKRRTVSDHAVQTLGVVQGGRAVLFMQLWAMFMVGEDRPPENVEELQTAMGTASLATLYRWRRAFLEAFPDEVDPSAMVERAVAEFGERRAAKEVGRLRWAT